MSDSIQIGDAEIALEYHRGIGTEVVLHNDSFHLFRDLSHFFEALVEEAPSSSIEDPKFSRSFYQLSRAWYAEANLRHVDFYDDIHISLSHEDGGADGEVCIEFYEDRVAKFRIFDDSFHLFRDFSDFFEALADEAAATPEHVVEILTRLGYRDATPEARYE